MGYETAKYVCSQGYCAALRLYSKLVLHGLSQSIEDLLPRKACYAIITLCGYAYLLLNILYSFEPFVPE